MFIDLEANEVVRKASDVQFLINDSGIKGKLILTNQRIYFKTAEENNKEHNMSIMPNEIRELMYFKTGLFSSNGLSFITKSGDEIKFSVKKRNEWSQVLNKLI